MTLSTTISELRVTKPVCNGTIHERQIDKVLIANTHIKGQTITESVFGSVGIAKSVVSSLATDHLSVGHLSCLEATSLSQAHIRNSNISIYSINKTLLSTSIVYNTILSGGTNHIVKSKISMWMDKCAFIDTVFYNLDFNGPVPKNPGIPTFKDCSFSGCKFIFCNIKKDTFESCSFSPKTPLGVYGGNSTLAASYPNTSVSVNKAIGCIAIPASLKDLGFEVSFVCEENADLLRIIRSRVQPIHSQYLTPLATNTATSKTIPTKATAVEMKHAYFFSTPGI